MTDQTPVAPQAPASAPVTAQDTPVGPGRQPDAPEAPQTAMERRIAQSGVGTPGCDCGHEGMGIGWHGTDCAWRARTTPDNPATSSDAADKSLRAQYAAVLRNADAHWCQEQSGVDYAALADAVFAVRDQEIEQLRNQVKRLGLMVDEYGAGAGLLSDKVRRARDLANLWLKRTDQLKQAGRLLTAALDHPTPEPAATEATEPATITDPEWLRQQYAAAIQPLLMDNLPKPIAAARAREIADTVLFVRDRHLAQLRQRLQLGDAVLDEPTPEGAGGRQAGSEPLATRAALVRDQAALAQVRLLIAAYRPRLKLADPILLGKLEQAVAQVGELEPAEAGERP